MLDLAADLRHGLDPVAFARDRLGTEPWSRQAEILRAVVDHRRVAVRSGHKIGKSTAAALAKAKGNQGAAAKALGINLRTVQKRLAGLFTAEERAAMAEQYGWTGVRTEKTK